MAATTPRDDALYFFILVLPRASPMAWVRDMKRRDGLDHARAHGDGRGAETDSPVSAQAFNVGFDDAAQDRRAALCALRDKAQGRHRLVRERKCPFLGRWGLMQVFRIITRDEGRKSQSHPGQHPGRHVRMSCKLRG
ncbi:hypothetical protein E4U43_002721 [Claviceps pusilla]|uniref:Uncharacterized protein n=1 Tax=Claviceps pusilla TaxID=123648 RepID=A0A9P7N5V9_9HYPO|nr:hypothetical protein E4U43_002721 [Claviceps pusilla]